MRVLVLLSMLFLASCEENQIGVDGPTAKKVDGPTPDSARTISGMAPVSGG
jgi:hypothetical protein